MAQVTSYVTPSSPLSMAQLKTALDNMFAAVVSTNRGATAPENPVEGMIWFDTSGDPTEVLKVYRSAGWRSLLAYNNTTGAITPYRNVNGTALASAFALTLLDDADADTALTTLGVSAYAKTILHDANASAALTTLGVSAFAKTILDDADADAVRTTIGATFANIVSDTSVTEAKMAASAISQAKLKTSSGNVSHNASVGVTGTLLTLPGGEYGFYPRTQLADSLARSTYAEAKIFYKATTGNQALASYIYLETNATGAGPVIYAYQRYVTSSGEVNWLFILRDKATKKKIASWFAPDHPCYGNGGKPNLVPHPFPDYNPATQEIIVINPTDEQITEMEAMQYVVDENKPDQSIGEIMDKFYEIDEESSPKWPTKAVTVGLPEGHNWQSTNKNIVPIKKVTHQPDGVTLKALKKRDITK